MKYDWQDLPERKNCFTIRNAVMVNLNTGKIVRYYSANTRITVVQKCVTPEKTYYRTSEAAHHYLNYAFEASAFGLPDEKAPSAPPYKKISPQRYAKPRLDLRNPSHNIKQKCTQQVAKPNDGEAMRHRGLFSRLFRRLNGKAKNS